jgi:hypothetical protein
MYKDWRWLSSERTGIVFHCFDVCLIRGIAAMEQHIHSVYGDLGMYMTVPGSLDTSENCWAGAHCAGKQEMCMVASQ